MGNIHSVTKALESLEEEIILIKNNHQIKDCKALILPGVGSFDPAINNLRNTDLIVDIKNWIKSGKSFLGICLGLQILFNSSEEDGESGFGLIKGKITKIKVLNDKNLKIPHMGWNHVSFSKEHNLFDGIKNNQFFYFVHSYVSYDAKDNVVASTAYGKEFISALCSENIFATQFHPEKSGKVGLKLLDNFINWKI